MARLSFQFPEMSSHSIFLFQFFNLCLFKLLQNEPLLHNVKGESDIRQPFQNSWRIKLHER